MDKILVVEDDKTVYSGIKKLLELQPYNNGYNDATVRWH